MKTITYIRETVIEAHIYWSSTGYIYSM